MAKKQRLDTVLVELGYFESREKAKRAIMAGMVFSKGQRIDKPGTQVDPAIDLEVRGAKLKYVSRGGLKLEKAIEEFGVSVDGKTCMDIGSSTGGFTDCMLQNGAVKVFAVDVGTGQLHWNLRQDDRVVVMERTNIRHVEIDHIGSHVDFASIDVSFISLDKVLPVAQRLLTDVGEVVFLIKPQFEAGREQVGKKGVVRDEKVHMEVLERILGLAGSLDLRLKALTYSPITGPAGNIEFLAWATKDKNCEGEAFDDKISSIVSEAHETLRKKSV